LHDEPERRAFNKAIEQAATCFMSAASFVEVSIVIDVYHGYEGLRDLDLFIATAGIDIVSLDAEQAHIARQAFREFRQGSSPRRPEFRRLLLLRPGQGHRSAAPLQRQRFPADRHQTGPLRIQNAVNLAHESLVPFSSLTVFAPRILRRTRNKET